MKLTVKYVYVKVNALETARTFFEEILGFEQLLTKFDLPGEHIVLKSGKSNTNIILLETKKKPVNAKLVIASEDCIKDYFKLKSSGVVFASSPTYIKEGLIAEFVDPFGNEYSLLEERDYQFGYL